MDSSRTRFGRVSIKVKLSGRGREIKRERRRACAQQQRQACQRNAKEREARVRATFPRGRFIPRMEVEDPGEEREREREENGIPNRG